MKCMNELLASAAARAKCANASGESAAIDGSMGHQLDRRNHRSGNLHNQNIPPGTVSNDKGRYLRAIWQHHFSNSDLAFAHVPAR